MKNTLRLMPFFCIKVRKAPMLNKPRTTMGLENLDHYTQVTGSVGGVAESTNLRHSWCDILITESLVSNFAWHERSPLVVTL